jgi:cAMP-specific phosphodiesterase 4
MGNKGTLGGYMRGTGWYESVVATRIKNMLRSRSFTAASIVSVFVALFCPDLFSLCQVPTNTELDIMLMISAGVFVTEWVGLSAVDAFYPLSFFFWLDFIATFSMVFDISFLLGEDVTMPNVMTETNKHNDVHIGLVRAARAARAGARAGRLSRIAKVVRFLSGKDTSEKKEEVMVAKVISKKLIDVLSMRVAFLTICISVVIPVIHLFEYPDIDESLMAWTRTLCSDVDSFVASSSGQTKARLSSELRRFAEFYAEYSYGPFRVSFENMAEQGFEFKSKFRQPRRGSSILEMVEDSSTRVYYDMSAAYQSESAMNIGLILFLILIMLIFSLILSRNIITIALTPLERMLFVVRERCAQIFKYTDDLEEELTVKNAGVTDENGEDKSNEFDLLERAVSKLASIALLSAEKPETTLNEEMTETQQMVQGFTHGTTTPTAERRNSVKRVHRSEEGGGGRMQAMATRRSANQTADRASNVSSLSSQQSEGEGLLNSVGFAGPVDGEGRERADPDFFLISEVEDAVPKHMIDSLQTPEFDSTACSNDELSYLGALILFSSEGSSYYIFSSCVEDKVLVNFAKECETQYKPNTFHNWAHAVDCAYAVGRTLALTEADKYMPEHGQFGLLVSALGHDLGHPGLNNPYLIETSHELAVMYNDRSPLENMHCAKLFEILKTKETNPFGTIEEGLYREVRKGIIEGILHTDLIKHNDMVKELSLLYQMNSEAFDGPERTMAGDEVLQDNVQLLYNSILHTSDIGNAMKPWVLAKRLAQMLLDEYFAIGDLEKAKGIPVQMLNDREKVNIPNSQIGFLEFLVTPLAEAMVALFQPLEELARNVSDNFTQWAKTWADESMPDEEAAEKVYARVQKVQTRIELLCDRRKMRSRRGIIVNDSGQQHWLVKTRQWRPLDPETL